MGYLRQIGFQLVRSGDPWCLFFKEIEGERWELEVPQRFTAPDYPRAVENLLGDLQRVERRPAAEILRDVLSTTVDLVRLGLKGQATENGRVSMEAEVRIREATRDLVLSAACAAIAPKHVYGKRKHEQAMKHLDVARFGTNEVSSYVVTVETPIPPKLQGALQPEDDFEPPYERRVGLVLASAIAGAQDAAQESAALGTLEPFTRRVTEGVSANLCEAVATLLDAADAHTLAVRFSFASVRPAPRSLPRLAEIRGDMTSILRAAATELRVISPRTDVEIQGPVLLLESDDVHQGGVVTVQAKIEGRPRKVRVWTAPGDYQLALAAHGAHRLVRCTGELVHEGRTLELRNPRGFTKIPEDQG